MHADERTTFNRLMETALMYQIECLFFIQENKITLATETTNIVIGNLTRILARTHL